MVSGTYPPRRRLTSWASLGALLFACGGRSADSHRAPPTPASGHGGNVVSNAGSGAPTGAGGTNGDGDQGGASTAGEPEVGGDPLAGGPPRGGAPSAGHPPIGGAPSAGRPPIGGAPAAGNPDLGGAPAGGLPSWGNCTYDSVGHGPNETFLARDGCNTCVCQGEAVACTETDCTPDCEHHSLGRLCVIGDWDAGGDGLMHYEVGAPLRIQVETTECISAWCNDEVIDTCSVAADTNGTDYTATADLCTRFVDRMLCDDCGSWSASCEAEPLTEGWHTVRLPGSNLTIDFNVPSAVPPLMLCVELGR